MKLQRFYVLLAWFVVTLFYTYQYILRVVPSVMMPDIIEKFSFTPDSFGQFSGIYYVGYSLMQLPIGAALDRFGPKKTLPFFIFLTVLGVAPLIYPGHLLLPIFGRFLIGVGSSAAILGVFKIIRISFSEKKFSRVLGFSLTVGVLGAIYGGAPLQMARQNLGYETVLVSLMALGAVLAIGTYLVLPATPKAQEEQGSILDDLKAIAANRKVVTLCFLAGLMVGPLEGFADVWGVQFLKTVYGLDDKLAASLPSLIFFGLCFGGPILSFLAEVTRRSLEVIIFSAAVMAAGFILLLCTKVSPLSLSILFFTIGICCAYQILIMDQVSSLVKPSQTGLTTALANMIIMIFGYVFHSAIGKIVAFSMKVADDSGVAVQTAESLVGGISVIPAALVLSVIGLFFYLYTNYSKLRLESN